MTLARLTGLALLLLGLAALLLHSMLTAIFGLAPEFVIFVTVLPFALGLGLLLGQFAGGRFSERLDAPRWLIGRAALLSCIVLIALVLVAMYVSGASLSDRSRMIAMVVVALFSGAIGFGELTQRYRDDPSRLFIAAPTIVYVAVNMAAAISAYPLIREFKVFSDANPAYRNVYEVMLAGFGSIAFFRSSFFTARVGDNDLDVGPSTLLKSLLDTSDRMINRTQAQVRLTDVGQIMAPVDFQKAKAALPMICFTVVENLTSEDEAKVAASIEDLIKTGETMTDQQRAIVLGTILLKVVGPVVLSRAVAALGDSILRD